MSLVRGWRRGTGEARDRLSGAAVASSSSLPPTPPPPPRATPRRRMSLGPAMAARHVWGGVRVNGAASRSGDDWEARGRRRARAHSRWASSRRRRRHTRPHPARSGPFSHPSNSRHGHRLRPLGSEMPPTCRIQLGEVRHRWQAALLLQFIIL
ncbi:hypothetical protein PAHAL_7G192600 [Panicum hallii]|uniref:Uncharacterized protein n=1 Tax=Panicum hallii TaxID=206008 RepID=A0A2S3I7P8_9POAL|nr:hypothetical protein PAHAL_7G192600 [Panicum hallii]